MTNNKQYIFIVCSYFETEKVLNLLSDSSDLIVDHCMSSGHHTGHDSLVQDWVNARSRIQADIILKLAYWMQLPWRLCALSHQNAFQVQAAAKDALKMFAANAPGSAHVMSRRFLDPHWAGIDNDNDPDDPPLRPAVEQLAQGAALHDLPETLLLRLLVWLGAFMVIRICERSIEGKHSIVHFIRKRAPAASTAYISMEIRFKLLLAIALKYPQARCFVSTVFTVFVSTLTTISTTTTFTTATTTATTSAAVRTTTTQTITEEQTQSTS
jgi:hypothetical protein